MPQNEELTWFNLIEKLKKKIKELEERIETLENV